MLYIDGILLASSDIDILYETKRFSSKKFSIKDFGEMYFVIDIKIHHDRSCGILGLSQNVYIEMVLSMFSM